MAERWLPLDACVLINLFATGRLPDIAATLGVRFVVVQEVADETFYLRSPGVPDYDRTPIDLHDLVVAGVLTLVDLESDELAMFVAIAERLDDGEAATLAISLHRGLPLATDDRAALRLIGAHHPGLEVLSTSQIIRRYSEQAGLSRADVAACLATIEQDASFVPSGGDPEVDWWLSARESTPG